MGYVALIPTKILLGMHNLKKKKKMRGNFTPFALILSNNKIVHSKAALLKQFTDWGPKNWFLEKKKIKKDKKKLKKSPAKNYLSNLVIEQLICFLIFSSWFV